MSQEQGPPVRDKQDSGHFTQLTISRIYKDNKIHSFVPGLPPTVAEWNRATDADNNGHKMLTLKHRMKITRKISSN